MRVIGRRTQRAFMHVENPEGDGAAFRKVANARRVLIRNPVAIGAKAVSAARAALPI